MRHEKLEMAQHPTSFRVLIPHPEGIGEQMFLFWRLGTMKVSSSGVNLETQGKKYS